MDDIERMNSEYTKNIEELVKFGLDDISPEEQVNVSLKDLLYVFQTLQEYQSFFHQRMHYSSIEDIHTFMDSGGYRVLATSIHEKLRDVFPDYVEEMFDNGDLESPKKPYYFKVNNET